MNGYGDGHTTTNNTTRDRTGAYVQGRETHESKTTGATDVVRELRILFELSNAPENTRLGFTTWCRADEWK